MTRLALAALLLGAGILPTTATAQAAPAVARVSHIDLDLSRAEGVATLDRRIRRAVATVCNFTSARELEPARVLRKCRINANRTARIGRDRVIAAANQRGGAKLAAVAR